MRFLWKNLKANSELPRLLKDGNMIAFDTIYDQYCKRLFAFIIRYVKLEADAEEIVQEVFIKIWENRSKIDVFSSFESYLFSISCNSSISFLHKRWYWLLMEKPNVTWSPRSGRIQTNCISSYIKRKWNNRQWSDCQHGVFRSELVSYCIGWWETLNKESKAVNVRKSCSMKN